MPELLISHHPVIHNKLAQLRAQDTPPAVFRKLVHELSFLLGVEATQDLATREVQVQTPLQRCNAQILAESIAIVPILRAGLGMSVGLSGLLPDAPVRHLGMYRDEETLQPVAYYSNIPAGQCEDLVLLVDPMLATGGSALMAIEQIKRWQPKRIKFLALLAAPEGVAALHDAHPDVAIHLCVLDEKLSQKGYILPGLGDAGDRIFNT